MRHILRFSASPRTVQERKVNGQERFAFDLNNLAPGSYVLRLVNVSGDSQMARIIKVQ